VQGGVGALEGTARFLPVASFQVNEYQGDLGRTAESVGAGGR
jgi:hypothetical protein